MRFECTKRYGMHGYVEAEGINQSINQSIIARSLHVE